MPVLSVQRKEKFVLLDCGKVCVWVDCNWFLVGEESLLALFIAATH